MPPKRTPTKYDPDPLDPAIRRWVGNLKRGSAATGDAWFRALRRFCAESKHTAQEVAALDQKALRDLFMDFASADEERKVGGSYTAYTLKVVKNWLRFNGVNAPAGVKVKSADSVFEETALSADQLRAALNAATSRERVAIVLMAQSGVRPEVIGNFAGSDGLAIKDLPELRIKGRTASFDKVPSPILVRQDLSKTSHKYVTFVGKEGEGIIIDSLQARLASGETLDLESPIYPPERTDLTTRKFVRTTKIGDSIRHAFRAAGLPNRPYVLRTTAASRFAEAENRGHVPHSYWQHWMGHSGDMSARYSVNRGRLPESLVEEMRAAYKRCERFLSTSASRQDSTEDIQREAAVLLLAGFRGLTEAEARRMTEGKSGSELANLLKSLGPSAPEKRTEKAVPVEDVPKMLEAGWEFVSPLNGSMAVLRAPHPHE